MGLQKVLTMEAIYITGFITCVMIVAFIFESILDKKNYEETLKSFNLDKYTKMHTLVERESLYPNYEHREKFNSLEEAQDRMKDLYHSVAVEGNSDVVEDARLYERSAIVYLNDGNEISWDIE